MTHAHPRRLLALALLAACGDGDGGTSETGAGATSEPAADTSTSEQVVDSDACTDDDAGACLACDSLSDALCEAYASDACPSHATAIQPIWTAYCSFCHGDAEPILFTLTGATAYDNLVDACALEPSGDCGMKRVTPYSPTQSYLWHKLRGTHNCVAGVGGDRMPADSAPLLDPLRENIERWICCGAPE